MQPDLLEAKHSWYPQGLRAPVVDYFKPVICKIPDGCPVCFYVHDNLLLHFFCQVDLVHSFFVWQAVPKVLLMFPGVFFPWQGGLAVRTPDMETFFLPAFRFQKIKSSKFSACYVLAAYGPEPGLPFMADQAPFWASCQPKRKIRSITS